MPAVGVVSLLAVNAPAFADPTREQPAQRPRPQSYAERVIAESKPIFGWPDLVKEARKYIGTNPTDRKRLWCATFMNLILAKLGYPGTNSDAAMSFASYGRRIAKPEVGAIAVLTRGKRGGHVGVVSGVDANGNPVIISGNHNRRVGVAVYPRSRVVAYVMPPDRRAGPFEAARANNPAAQPAAAGSQPDSRITSPFAELFAVLSGEAEATEASRRQTAAPVPEPRPHRIVQQLPAQRSPGPQ